jgi:hypothetical protein
VALSGSVLGTNITNALDGAGHGAGHGLPLEDGGLKGLLAVAFEEGEFEEALLVFGGKPGIDVLLVAEQLAVLLLGRTGRGGRLTLRPALLDDLLQTAEAHPLEGGLFVLQTHLLHQSDGLEHVDDVVQPPDLRLYQRRVLSVDQDLRSLLQRNRSAGEDEDLEEARRQVLERLLLLGGEINEVAAVLSDGVDGAHCLLEAAPNIIILGGLFDHLQALEDVHNVVDASALDLQLQRDAVELQNDAVPALEALDELLAELLQTLLLAVVAEDLLLELLLPREVVVALLRTALADCEDGQAQRK